MTKYEVRNRVSSHSFGVYDAENAEAAIEACCIDAGYANSAKANAINGSADELIAVEVNDGEVYTLTSTKGGKDVAGSLGDAFIAAFELADELQPAYGVTISADDGDYQLIDGRIAVEFSFPGEADDSGHVMRVDGALVIVWDRGETTPFSGRGLIPA